MSIPEQEIAAEDQRIHIKLNGNGVVAPALKAMRESGELIALCLHALEKADLDNIPRILGSFLQMQFQPNIDADVRRRNYQAWLLSRGFQEIARGVRLSLEEALLFIGMIQTHEEHTTLAEIRERAQAFRRRANQLNFHNLLRDVNRGLLEPLRFEREYLSLQKVRNCLEHRDGVVGNVDLDRDSEVLTLALPYMKIFYEEDGAEVELAPGLVTKSEVLVKMRRDTRERIYRRGERIEFSPADFHEIAMACFLFAGDIQTKLPTQTRS